MESQFRKSEPRCRKCPIGWNEGSGGSDLVAASSFREVHRFISGLFPVFDGCRAPRHGDAGTERSPEKGPIVGPVREGGELTAQTIDDSLRVHLSKIVQDEGEFVPA